MSGPEPEAPPQKLHPLQQALIRALTSHPYWHGRQGGVETTWKFDAVSSSWFISQRQTLADGTESKGVNVRAATFENAALELMLVVEKLWMEGA